jgi:hypothetical protein
MKIKSKPLLGQISAGVRRQSPPVAFHTAISAALRARKNRRSREIARRGGNVGVRTRNVRD